MVKGLMGYDTLTRRIGRDLERSITSGWRTTAGLMKSLYYRPAPAVTAASAPLQMNTTIEVTVPPGTPESQHYVLKQAADSAFREFWDTQLRHTLMTHRSME